MGRGMQEARHQLVGRTSYGGKPECARDSCNAGVRLDFGNAGVRPNISDVSNAGVRPDFGNACVHHNINEHSFCSWKLHFKV